ncbi:MAG: FtsX-like permease family protein [Pseudomonadota bacterium]|nr:FtsX-like permease family protein [Pseudomonadota bacterium]
MLHNWLVALRLARRDLRGGLAGFRILLLSLGLGVAAIAGVGSLTASILEGMAANGRVIIGGDIDLRLTHRAATADELDWLDANSLAVGTSLTMRTIIHGPDGDARALSELKAVDGAWPLFGSATLADGSKVTDALAPVDGVPGMVVDPLLARRLGVDTGDTVRMGEATFRIAGMLGNEPDRGSSGSVLFGPRSIVALDAMAHTGLLQPGSLVYWHYKLVLPDGADIEAFTARMNAALPDAGWRVLDRQRGAPGVESFILRLRVFLTLVGLTALLVGGVGVGNAVSAHLDSRRTAIAVLKCTGATGADITRIFLIQILLLGGIGIAGGLVLGAIVPFLTAGLLAQLLPAAPEATLFPGPLALAALFGLLVTLAFTLWPLGAARRTRAGGLFRAVIGDAGERPPLAFVLGAGLSLAGLAALALFSSDNMEVAGWFVVSAIGCFAVLRGAAWAIARLAARVEGPRSSAFRMALANLHRPGAPTASVMVSLGLGVTLLAAIALIEGNIADQVDRRVAEEAPTFFFLDIQPDQIDDFRTAVLSVPGTANLKTVPTLRGRITRLNGEPADEARVDPGEAWVLRGDRGLTYAADAPANSPVVAGEWWPADYAGPPLVSFEDEAAAGLGLKLGDTITVNVLGREMTATIANLRRIDWSSFSINYVMIFDPGMLRGAPHTLLATVEATDSADPLLFRTITDRFPTITAIRVKDAIVMFDTILAQVAMAVRSAATVTLAAGLLVLAGAIAAGHRRRVREAVVLKVIGATRGQILRITALEFAVLGGVTAIVAGLAGTAAAWVVIEGVMDGEFTLLPARLGIVVFGAIGLTTALGLAGAWRALGRRPAAELRVA